MTVAGNSQGTRPCSTPSAHGNFTDLRARVLTHASRITHASRGTHASRITHASRGTHASRITPASRTSHAFRVTLVALVALVALAVGLSLPSHAAPASSPTVRTVAVMPASHAGAVELLSGERELTTYRATRDTPVTLEIYGPTELKVNARLEFTPALRGSQAYVLDVRRDGKSALSVTFRARRSDVTSYRRTGRSRTPASARSAARARSERMPGVADRVRIPVPAGRHRYTIRLRGTTAPGILISTTIPARDVTRGEVTARSPR